MTPRDPEDRIVAFLMAAVVAGIVMMLGMLVIDLTQPAAQTAPPWILAEARR